MPTVRVDDQVYSWLQSLARPFADTPNSVLRRVAGLDETPVLAAPTPKIPVAPPVGDPQPGGEKRLRNKTGRQLAEFVGRVLADHFSGTFRPVPPYRFMFESPHDLVYFQNFNKAGEIKLWYRLEPGALSTLKSTSAKATVCLTNPADRFMYAIPLRDILDQASRVGWDREHIEANIDHQSRTWADLDWQIGRYFQAV